MLLKIDAQGFKLRVREGAGATLRSIGLHQIELSLVPLYDGGPLLPEMITWLAKRCYRLFGL